MSYILDANIFIEAKNRYYGLDFCPAFWDWLLRKQASGDVFSIDKVYDELLAGADELTTWVQNNGNVLFRATDATVAPHFPVVSNWATGQQYEPTAINTFLQAADYYLVAHAIAGGHTLVTHEVASPSRKKIKIPDACVGLRVRFMSPYQMLRIERAQFVLGPAR